MRGALAPALLTAAAALAAAAGPGAGLAFAAAAVLVLGMPHGAGDLMLVRDAERPGFIGVYLSAGALVLTAWRFTPEASLAGFLILSLVHFAADAEPGERWAAALVPIATPALLHRDELSALFAAIGVDPSVAGALATAMAVGGVLGAAAGFSAAAAIPARRAALALGTGAAVLLPPLPGFAVAFVLLHAGPQTARRAAAAGRGTATYLRAAAPATAGAVMVAAAALLWFRDRPAPELAALFGAISALATPHMLVTPLFARGGAAVPIPRYRTGS